MSEEECRLNLYRLVEALKEYAYFHADAGDMHHMCYDHNDELACEVEKRDRKALEEAERAIKEYLARVLRCLKWL